MVRALSEAWRVLKPGGLLIDLRPAIQHRRVSVVRSGRARPVGALREDFADDHAANRAVARMTGRAGRRGAATARTRRGGVPTRSARGASRTPPLQFVSRTRIDCNRVMDGLDDFRDWVADFTSRDDKLPPHDWLIERVERALAQEPGRAQVVVAGPLDLRLLRKAPKQDSATS